MVHPYTPRRHHRRRRCSALDGALGETMAVTFVIGNAHSHRAVDAWRRARPSRPPSPMSSPRPSATSIPPRSIALGLILFFITFIVLAAARLMLMRIEQKAGELTMAASASRWDAMPADAAANVIADGAVGRRRRLRPDLAVADPDRARRAKAWAVCRLAVFTEMTPPPGASRRPAESHCRQPDSHRSRGSCSARRSASSPAPTWLSMAATPSSPWWSASSTTFCSSAPSIVVGLFVYEIMVAQMGHFSAWAGARGSRHHRHPGRGAHHRGHAAARAQHFARGIEAALGLPRWIVIRDVAYRAARAGMITGVLLAVARITGETAPLLFTALNNQFFSWNLNAPMASLPVVIFQFALESLRGLAAACLDRRSADHRHRARV